SLSSAIAVFKLKKLESKWWGHPSLGSGQPGPRLPRQRRRAATTASIWLGDLLSGHEHRGGIPRVETQPSSFLLHASPFPVSGFLLPPSLLCRISLLSEPNSDPSRPTTILSRRR
ncbi:hypothetical protein Taro_010394, partial [Colocasia esculenta]|nr:hypothetical protein [Colocasia esculenta]